jgi:hypothetical protein
MDISPDKPRRSVGTVSSVHKMPRNASHFVSCRRDDATAQHVKLLGVAGFLCTSCLRRRWRRGLRQYLNDDPQRHLIMSRHFLCRHAVERQSPDPLTLQDRGFRCHPLRRARPLRTRRSGLFFLRDGHSCRRLLAFGNRENPGRARHRFARRFGGRQTGRRHWRRWQRRNTCGRRTRDCSLRSGPEKRLRSLTRGLSGRRRPIATNGRRLPVIRQVLPSAEAYAVL